MLARHRDPRVVPLEVWDLLLDGVALYDVKRGAGFGAALERAVEMLIAGTGVCESGSAFPAECREIQRVVLVGGAAREWEWTGRVPVSLAREARVVAEAGGHAILARAGVRGLVVDLGQSRLKISGGRRWVFERDLERIPISGRPVDGRGRGALVEFVAGALRVAARAERPEALVLALPCEIGADGALGTCSYPWTAGDTIVEEVLRAAGLADVPGWLLNDAELAAIGVAEQEVGAGVTLVVTLGFGVGAALLRGAG